MWIYFTLFKLNVECGYEGMYDIICKQMWQRKSNLSYIFILHSIQVFIIGKQAWAYNVSSSNFNVCFAQCVDLSAVVDIVFQFQKRFDSMCESIMTYNIYIYIYIYIYIINQQDATLAVLCLLKNTSMLYMFRTPFASIFRSTINCNSSHWCLSWVRLE